MKPDERQLLAEFSKRGPYNPGDESFLAVSERLGMPYKRARYIARKWSDKGFYAWGTTWRVGWLTKEVEV